MKKEQTPEEKDATIEKKNTGWHQILEKIWEEWLTPVGITVKPNFAVMAYPPEADFFLLRRKGRSWTKAQMARLPDGIRDSTCRQILVEFKYSKSISLESIIQTITYDYLYLKYKKLKPHQVASFLISSKSPLPSTLKELEFTSTNIKGVYRGTSKLTERITLISTNELSDSPHNMTIKLFASKKRELKKAFKTFQGMGKKTSISEVMETLVMGLRKRIFQNKGEIMENQITVEDIEALGKEYRREVALQEIKNIPMEKIVDRKGIQTVIKEVGTKNIVKEVGLEKFIETFGVDQLEKQIKKMKKQQKKKLM